MMTSVGLVVVSDSGLIAFNSLNAAESYMEAIDVEDGVYSTAFDADGRFYEITYSGLSTWETGKAHLLRTSIVDSEAASLAIKKGLGLDPRKTIEFRVLLAMLERHLAA